MKTLIAALVALSTATALVAPAAAGVSIKGTFDGPAFGLADMKGTDGPAFGPADVKTFDGPGFGPSDVRGFDGPGCTSQDGGNQR